MSLPPYRKIDQSTWSRQDHYSKLQYDSTPGCNKIKSRMRPVRSAFLCGIHLVYVKCCEPPAIYEDDDGRRRQSGSVGCCASKLYNLSQRRSHIF